MEKRNWFKSLDPNDMLTCDENGAAESYIPFVFIEKVIYDGEPIVRLMGWQSCYYNTAEDFDTEKKLDSFIEALIDAKEHFYKETE